MIRHTLAASALAVSALTMAAMPAAAADQDLRDLFVGRSYVTQTPDGPVIVYFGRDGVAYGDAGDGNWTVNENREVCTQFEPEPTTCWTVENYEVIPAYDPEGLEVDRGEWLATDDRKVCTTVDSEAQTCFEFRSDGTLIEMQAGGESQRGILLEGNARRLKKGS